MKSLPNRSGVYVIETPGGAQYVGSSRDMRERRHGHRGLLKAQRHRNNRLQDAWNKHGDDLAIRPLLFCSIDDLKFYEQRAIDVLRPRLNISQDARGPHEFTSEHREKLSAAKLGKVGPRLGQSLDADARARISAKLKGHVRPMSARMKQMATYVRRHALARIANAGGLDYEVQS